MQGQFCELRSRYDLASVFVTHDLLEALALGTRIAVLHSGKLEAMLSPDEFFDATTPVARAFLETLPVEFSSGRRR